MSSEQYRGGDSDPLAAAETATVAIYGADAGPSAAPRVPVFLPSEVLADRFRVVRLLGRGGMGEIYEVEDFELGERVAIKTLRSRLSGSDGALALFRNEIQLARRITHPNVCRTFDVFRHRRLVPGGSESVAFVTMELLPGDSLAARLRRDGPLSLAASLPLLRQIAAALDAAHDAGVVHRDLKSGNVLLVDEAGGPRAVVADFGLASGIEEAAGGTGAPYGTRPYRAPEQEVGEPAGAAADVHAFGVVVAEVLTGHAEWSVAEPRLQPAVAEVVRACLARRPEDRPERAGDVVRRLERLAHPGGSRRRRLATAAAAALLALLPVAVLATWPLQRGSRPAAAPPSHHRQIAVLVSAPEPGVACPDCLGIELSELLGVELRGSGAEVMDGDELYGFWGLAPALRGTAEQRRAGLDLLGADLLAEVRVLPETADRRRYEIRLGGELGPRGELGSRGEVGAGGEGGAGDAAGTDGSGSPSRWTFRAAPGDEARVAADLAAHVRRRLGISTPRPSESLRRRLLGSDPRALELYARGLHGLTTPLSDSLRLLRRAVALEPGAFRFQLALGWRLIEARPTAGDALEPAAEVQRLAAPLAGEAGRDDQLVAAVLSAQASRDWPAAAEASLTLARRHPERVGAWATAIGLAILAGRTDEAEDVLAELRASRPSLLRHPRLLQMRTDLSYAEGDPEATVRTARANARRSAELGLENPLFSARRKEFRALRDLGRGSEAVEMVEDTIALAERTGRRRWLSQALRWRGVLFVGAGDPTAAEDRFQRALALARQSGDEENAVWCLNNLAVLAAGRGELARADAMWEEALVPLRQFYDQRQLLFMRSNLTEMWLLQGRLDDAEQACREIHSAAQVVGDVPVEVLVVARLAQIALERGELAAAGHELERAEKLARRSANFMLPQVLTDRARLMLLRGEPAAARRQATAAVEAARSAGMPVEMAKALAAVAGVEVAEGRFERALTDYQQALERARTAPDAVLAANLEREIGSVERRLGDWSSAAVRLTSALDAHRRFGCTLEAAHDQLAQAELRRDTGDTAAAAEAARGALATYRRLGAAGAAATAEALLRELAETPTS